jgi:hypothetical protein
MCIKTFSFYYITDSNEADLNEVSSINIEDKTSLSSINAKTINTCDGLAHSETICRQYKSSISIDSSMLVSVKHVFNPVNIQ